MANHIAQPLDFLGLDVSLLAPKAPGTQGKVRHPDEALLGGQITNLPVTLEPRNTFGGVGGYSTFDDYYETIHVRPARIDVGRLTAAVRREVEVWSAYRNDSRTLESVAVEADDGIDLDGPTLPYDYGPLESQTFTLDVTPEGPATIAANYDLTFTTPERDPSWFVEGVRLIEWTVEPNWAGGFEERFAFKTEVLSSFDGSEQRIALRHRPRRFFAFSPLAAGERDRELKRLLSTWQNRTYAMADWPRGVSTNGVPAGGQSVLLSKPLEGLTEGGLIALRYGRSSQVIEVEKIEGDLIRLNSPVLQAFPAGTMAYVGLTVHADKELTSQRITSHIGELGAQFREMHVAGKVDLPNAATTFREAEVFDRKPNWGEQVDLTHAWDVAWLDTDRGAFDYRTPHDAPKDVRQFVHTLDNREQVAEVRDVFFRAKGRRGELYVPTWDDDLQVPPGVVLAAGTTQLPVTTPGESTRMANERVYRNICMRLTDGTHLYRHITAGGFNNNDPILVVDTGWPRNIVAEEIVAIHFMPRCRFASDELLVNWLTDGIAEATMAFQVLEDRDEEDS